MKWKNEIWVFDDIIPVEQQEYVKSVVLGTDFQWHFIPDITSGGSRDERPGFSHGFIKDGEVKSHEAHIQMLEMIWAGCMEKMHEKTQSMGNYSVNKARTFLQLPLRNVKGGEYDAHHIDLFDEHFALLYYVCDADGDTVIFENMYSKENPNPPELDELKEKVRVTPKQGRVVIFDGYYWHTATQPTQGVRCVINTDVLQHD